MSQNENQTYKYVPVDHVHMIAASLARKECAGDSIYPIGVVLVKDDVIVARAGNGFNRGSAVKHVCPRVVLECPSLTGYELCSLHGAPGHAEKMLINIAMEQGIDPAGCDVYMCGHWWCCDSCWKAMVDAKINHVYIVDDAQDRFSRNNVFAETLSGNRTDVRVEQQENEYHVYVPESTEPVFIFEADSPELAERRLKNVIRQL